MPNHDEERRESLVKELRARCDRGPYWDFLGGADFILSREAPLLSALERAFSRLLSLRYNAECGPACRADAAHIESVLKAHLGAGVVDPPPMTPEHWEDVEAFEDAMRRVAASSSSLSPAYVTAVRAIEGQRAREAARAPEPEPEPAPTLAEAVAVARAASNTVQFLVTIPHEKWLKVEQALDREQEGAGR